MLQLALVGYAMLALFAVYPLVAMTLVLLAAVVAAHLALARPGGGPSRPRGPGTA